MLVILYIETIIKMCSEQKAVGSNYTNKAQRYSALFFLFIIIPAINES